MRTLILRIAFIIYRCFFCKIVTALVTGVIMSPIGVLLGGVNFTDLAIVVKDAVGDAPAVVISYGAFIQTVIDFTLIALAIFVIVKGINKDQHKYSRFYLG